MSPALISPSGAVLHHRGRRSTTPAEQAEVKAVTIKQRKECRRDENLVFLNHVNVRAFLRAICETLGGAVDAVQGGRRGQPGERHRFSDFSCYPMGRRDGAGTLAGSYLLTRDVWEAEGARMGLCDFSAQTQDLVAVEILRVLGAIDKIRAGELVASVLLAARRWPLLPTDGALRGPDDFAARGIDRFLQKYLAHRGTLAASVPLAGAAP